MGPNNSGSGPDRASGGNYVVIGGGIQGGNSFPDSLLPGPSSMLAVAG